MRTGGRDRPVRVVEQDGERKVVFAFGKHRGRPLAEVTPDEPDYCFWMLAVACTDDACELVKAALGRG